MSQLKRVVEPFGEVNVYPSGGKTRVVATILMEPHREGAQTGIALDGSGSMAKLYGAEGGTRVLSSLFAPPKKENQITPVAQKLCAYLARKLDADGGTTCIYWSTGPGGGQIEVVGDLTAEQAERHVFGPPQDFGTGTQLLPAVRYFTERFRNAPWGFYVIVTDGELHDLDEVLSYSKQLAREIASGRRRPVKFVLIGIGPDVNEAQMTELDDLDTGTDVDLWDHKLASEMRQLEEIFAEVVDKNARVADNGRILDASGKVIKDYTDVGLPAYLAFEVPAGSDYFVLEVNGQRIQQPLSDSANVPASPSFPVATEAPTLTAQPVSAPEAEEDVPYAQPVGPEEEGTLTLDSDADAEWKALPLEFAPEGEQDKDTGLDLDRPSK